MFGPRRFPWDRGEVVGEASGKGFGDGFDAG